MTKLARIAISYALAASMLIPFLWMVSTSFKNPADVFEFPVRWIPKPFNWDGYRYVWQESRLGVSFYIFYLNSIKVSLFVLIGTYFSCSLAAYAYSKISFKGRDVIFLLKLSTMMIPFQVTMIPNFIMYRKLGLIDTHMSLWIASFLGSTFGVFLLKQFFASIPDEMIEAARIDGASHLTIYRKLAMPLTKPALVTLMVLTFIATWNNYEAPLLYLRTPSLYTIPIGLKVMVDDAASVHYPGIMAGVVSSLIPILLLFVAAEKYFVKGVTFTSVKG